MPPVLAPQVQLVLVCPHQFLVFVYDFGVLQDGSHLIFVKLVLSGALTLYFLFGECNPCYFSVLPVLVPTIVSLLCH